MENLENQQPLERIFPHNKPSGLDYDCKQITTSEGRYYVTPEGVRYPSVSSIVSLMNEDSIKEWKERVGMEEATRIGNRAARRGTDVHFVCENFLNNKLTRLQIASLMPSTKELFLQLRPYLQKHVDEVYCLEQTLYSTKLRTAGKTDAALVWESIPSILDYKTSTRYKKEEHILHYLIQCTIYAIMFKERTGQAIEQIVVIIAVEGEKHPQIFKKSIHPFVPLIEPLIERYWSKHSTLLSNT